MKKIAVTQRLVLNDNYYELREALDVNWGVMFEKLDFLPIVLPLEYSFEKYFKLLNIDGIILTGGNDLNVVNENMISKKRDIYEQKLIKHAIEMNIPLFGICRGMQIIADFFGSDFNEVKDQVAIRHKLKINKDSKYFVSLNKIKEVNSFHNYAVKTIPAEMLVSAMSEDGIIKAIEHKKYKIFGQMWHSEREDPLSEIELNLIKEFFND